jgi:hypothetical protein
MARTPLSLLTYDFGSAPGEEVVSMHVFAHAQQRRSTRIDKAMPIVVHGVGALREPYDEQVSTLSISCHGCTYLSRNEVIQGDAVFLDVKPANDAGKCSTRARVKWVQKVPAKDKSFQVAVELEVAGNIWGIVAPPSDWFPAKLLETIESTGAGRELRVISRKEQQIEPAHAAVMEVSSRPERTGTALASAQPITQLMVGVGEQIQAMAAEAAAAALVREKSRILDEFRSQLRDEAVKTLQSAISASKEVIGRQALKELSESHEAEARTNYAAWTKKIERDMESARQHILSQVKEVSRSIDGMALSTVERVQRNMETTRGEAVERFVSRLRDQINPMLEVAKDSLQRLGGAENALRKESQAIFAELENQLALSTNASLAKAHEELETNTAAALSRSNESLQQLYQSFEQAVRDNATSLIASAEGQMTEMLRGKAADLSREFSAGLEVYTRNYLETIGKSISEIPQNIPVKARQ